MSNEYTNILDNISTELNEYKGINPVSWVDDRTRLNAANLNSLSSSITALLGAAEGNERVLKGAIDKVINVAKAIAGKWNDSNAYDEDLTLSKNFTTTGEVRFKSNVTAEGDISVARGKDVKIGNISVSDILDKVPTLESTISSHNTAIEGINTTIASHNTDITGLKVSTNNIVTNMNALQTDISNAFGGIDSRFTSAENDISSLKAGMKLVDDNKTNLTTISTLNLTEEFSNLHTLIDRVTALENMIVAGVVDPEQANLSDSTKYYIKYED